MVEIREAITVSEAVDRVMNYKKRGEIEEVSFHECDGRRLAEPVLATNDIPSFHKSPYDGFALRAEDTVGAASGKPVQLKVIEHIGAGILPEKEIQKGEAIRIMKGPKTPKGAKVVEMFEKCVEKTVDGAAYIPKKHEITQEQTLLKRVLKLKKEH